MISQCFRHLQKKKLSLFDATLINCLSTGTNSMSPKFGETWGQHQKTSANLRMFIKQKQWSQHVKRGYPRLTSSHHIMFMWIKSAFFKHTILHTVDGRNPANQLIGRLSHYLRGFIHSRWLAGFLNHQQYLLAFRQGSAVGPPCLVKSQGCGLSLGNFLDKYSSEKKNSRNHKKFQQNW